jgi:hypothetical protein
MAIRTALFLMGAMAAAGCGSSNSTGLATQASLRMLNGSPDGPPVDLYVYGSRIVTNLGYATSTSYIPIGTGPATIKVVATGDSIGLATTSTAFVTGQAYSVFAVGKIATLSLLVATDSNTAPAGDSARLRFVHGSPSSPAVDVYQAPLGSPASAIAIYHGVAFKHVSPYVTVPAAPSEILVTAAGSTTTLVDDTLATLPVGSVRTIVLLDKQGGGPPAMTKNISDNK